MLRLTVKRGHLVRSPRLTSPAIDVNMTHTHKRQTAMFVSATFRAILEHFFLWLFHASPLRFVFFYEVQHNCVTIYNRSPIDIVSQYAPGYSVIHLYTRLLFRSLPHILDCHFLPIFHPQKIRNLSRSKRVEPTIISL
jgi:hypothetical protein